MQIEAKIHRKLRYQNIAFVALFILALGLIAFLSNKHTYESDWTSGNRNTLSETSIGLLSTLDKPLHFSVYATNDENVRKPIFNLIERYRRVKPDIVVEFINPELEPVLTRELAISMNGEAIVSYGDRDEHVTEHTEQNYSNTIQRLARNEQRWVSFVSGHGERDPSGMANHDLLEWTKTLKSKGINSHSLNLTQQTSIPDNTAVLVIAGPQVDYLPGEIKIIEKYLESGGNLLWLADPGPLFKLESIADILGIEFQSGIIVDPTTQDLRISDPRIAIITEYPNHPITENFNVLTLFPQARNIVIKDKSAWESTNLLNSLPRSWAELGEMNEDIEFNAGVDLPGPLVIGVTLIRKITPSVTDANSSNSPSSQRTQRVIVVGDGDFLSNTFIGNGGNLNLGLSMMNWLSHDDQFITIPATTTADIHLDLSPAAQAIVGFGFLIFLPLAFVGSGVLVWLKRRNR